MANASQLPDIAGQARTLHDLFRDILFELRDWRISRHTRPLRNALEKMKHACGIINQIVTLIVTEAENLQELGREFKMDRKKQNEINETIIFAGHEMMSIVQNPAQSLMFEKHLEQARVIAKNARWLPTVATYVEDRIPKAQGQSSVDEDKLRNEAFLKWLKLTEPKLEELLTSINARIESLP